MSKPIKQFVWAVVKGGKFYVDESTESIKVFPEEKWAKSYARTVGGEAIKVMIKER